MASSNVISVTDARGRSGWLSVNSYLLQATGNTPRPSNGLEVTPTYRRVLIGTFILRTVLDTRKLRRTANFKLKRAEGPYSDIQNAVLLTPLDDAHAPLECVLLRDKHVDVSDGKTGYLDLMMSN